MEEEIFFNALSSFQDTSFENLKIGDKVYISFKQTDQGPLRKACLYPNTRRKQLKKKPPLLLKPAYKILFSQSCK